jgi:hypothetical protein
MENMFIIILGGEFLKPSRMVEFITDFEKN